MSAFVGLGMYGDLRVVGDPHMLMTVEDWSGVRSPSRAARRRRQGHSQRIVYRRVPKPEAYIINGTLVMHPEMVAKLRAATTKVTSSPPAASPPSPSHPHNAAQGKDGGRP